MGNGFYAVDSKESLWVGRRLVVRDKEKGITSIDFANLMFFSSLVEEFYDDFSGVECPKGMYAILYHFSLLKYTGSIRELLGLHPTDMVEVVASKYPKYEVN